MTPTAAAIGTAISQYRGFVTDHGHTPPIAPPINMLRRYRCTPIRSPHRFQASYVQAVRPVQRSAVVEEASETRKQEGAGFHHTFDRSQTLDLSPTRQAKAPA